MGFMLICVIVVLLTLISTSLRILISGIRLSGMVGDHLVKKADKKQLTTLNKGLQFAREGAIIILKMVRQVVARARDLLVGVSIPVLLVSMLLYIMVVAGAGYLLLFNDTNAEDGGDSTKIEQRVDDDGGSDSDSDSESQEDEGESEETPSED